MAADLDEVGFVACLQPEQETVIGRCAFQEGVGVRVLGISVASVNAGGVTIYPRLRHDLPIHVIDPQSGETLADGVIEGKPPPACDDYVGSVSDSTFEGAGVDEAAVSDWLTTHRIP
jgi:hypothetical protein